MDDRTVGGVLVAGATGIASAPPWAGVGAKIGLTAGSGEAEPDRGEERPRLPLPLPRPVAPPLPLPRGVGVVLPEERLALPLSAGGVGDGDFTEVVDHLHEPVPRRRVQKGAGEGFLDQWVEVAVWGL